jgi:hypothetical protein
MALTTQVGPGYSTSIAPRRAKERQCRTAVLTKPGAAPAASGAALRIDQINGEFSSMSEGVDDALGIRIFSCGSSREIEARLCTERNNKRRHQLVPAFACGSGGGIRTPDLWVMSPTSCRCSTPRQVPGRWLSASGFWLSAISNRSFRPDRLAIWLFAVSPPRLTASRLRHEGGGCPRRPRLPWGRPHSTLRRCAGSRPGSGWDRVGPARSRPRAPPTPLGSAGALVHVCVAVSQSATRRHTSHGESAPRSCPLARAPCSAPSRFCVSVAQARPGEGDSPPSGARRPTVGSRRRWDRSQDLRPRPLGRLGSSRLPAVHLPPINPVICRGSYLG